MLEQKVLIRVNNDNRMSISNFRDGVMKKYCIVKHEQNRSNAFINRGDVEYQTPDTKCATQRSQRNPDTGSMSTSKKVSCLCITQ